MAVILVPAAAATSPLLTSSKLRSLSLSLWMLSDAPTLLSLSLSLSHALPVVLDASGYTKCLRSLGADPPEARISTNLDVSWTAGYNSKKVERLFPATWLSTKSGLLPQASCHHSVQVRMESD